MSLLRAPLCVIDTETSGFASNRLASVIDVGAVLLDVDGNEIAHFSTLVQPIAWGDWAAEATRINHITYDMVHGAPKPATVARDFEAWLAEHGCVWITSYSTAFDRPMLHRMGAAFPQHAKDVMIPETLPRWGACIQRKASIFLAKAGLLKEPGNHTDPIRVDGVLYRPASLRAACEFFGVSPVEPAHRALSDAQTAGRVLVSMLRRSR